MFSETAAYYDSIYAAAGKDYAAEAATLHALIQKHKRSAGSDLLDVACGTGCHLAHMAEHYPAEGLDLDPGMLAVARIKLPGIPLHEGDMVDFDLGRQFDAVVNLFSSIGYVKTVPRLRQALRAMARHARPGGVVAIEPWMAPGQFSDGYLGVLTIDEPELKITRMSLSRLEGELSIVEFQYLVATRDGINHFTERHELGLFTAGEYEEAFREAGLHVVYDSHGLSGRGLYVGIKPS